MTSGLDQISGVAVGYAALVVLASAYAGLRWRARPPWLASMAWLLEALAVLRAAAGVGAILSGHRPEEYTTQVGYLVASVCILPLALRSIEDDDQPWSLGVVGVAALAVGVIEARLIATL